VLGVELASRESLSRWKEFLDTDFAGEDCAE
jgi:hypothetical protein